MNNYKIIYEHGAKEQGRGAWSACVSGLPGCITSGDTHAECEAKIREAIELYEANLETTAPPAIPGRPPGSSGAALTTSELTKKAG